MTTLKRKKTIRIKNQKSKDESLSSNDDSPDGNHGVFKRPPPPPINQLIEERGKFRTNDDYSLVHFSSEEDVQVNEAQSNRQAS